jgi:2-hydroxy-4-carboxymuconate semialdehyde hemiacetal dehydrogenase
MTPFHDYLPETMDTVVLMQTYCIQRTNINAPGKPLSWTDHLLWHHSTQSVDPFPCQAGAPIEIARTIESPRHR